MGSLCLSSAPILRCESLNRVQVIALVIPTVFEATFSTAVIFVRRGTADRQYLWLTVEGWIYLVLALLEMVSHLVPAVRDSAGAFQAFDTVLAVISFLPLLCYTLFILLFTRAELISILPARFRTISKLMLPIFILIIGTFNQLASFIGISRDFVGPGQQLIRIGFRNNKDQSLWTFFTSLTLALLTVYQAFPFVFALYRVIRVYQDQRRIETTEADEAHLFGGTVWICGGFKLGTIETVVGFAGGTFGVALSRRILRFLGRAVICIGIAKGLDALEDFRQIQRELVLSTANRREYRRSRIREFISNPRLSTFRQLSPTATAFHAAPRAPAGGLARPSPLARPESDVPNMTQLASINTAPASQIRGSTYQRVTLHFKNGTPVLDVRFSELDIPNIISGRSRSRLQPEFAMGLRVMHRSSSHQHSGPNQNQIRSSHPPSLLSFLDISSDSGSERNLAGSSFYNLYAQEPLHHVMSFSSGQVSPLAAVRELMPLFPVVPPLAIVPAHRLTAGRERNRDYSDHGSSVVSGKMDNESMTGNLSHTSLLSERQPTLTPADLNNNTQSNYIIPSSASTVSLAGYTPTPSTGTPDPEGGLLDLGTALRIGKAREVKKGSERGANPAEWIDYDAIAQPARGGSAMGGRERSSRISSGPQGVDVEREGELQAGCQGRVSRIKSIGAAPRRSTPAPVRTMPMRSSLHLEEGMIPLVQPGMIQEGSSLGSDYGHVLRDVEVLAIKAGSRARDVRQLS